MEHNKPSARKEFLATHQGEAVLQKADIDGICNDIGDYENNAMSFATNAVKLANDARAIGAKILDFWGRLPGKTMTIDFWEQMSDLFVSKRGRQISLDQLKRFVRVAQNERDEIKKPQLAFAWRQELLLAGGLEWDGGRVGVVETEKNYYSVLLRNLDPRNLDKPLKGLMEDEHFGPIDHWSADRRERVRLHIEPFKKRLDAIWAQLNEGSV